MRQIAQSVSKQALPSQLGQATGCVQPPNNDQRVVHLNNLFRRRVKRRPSIGVFDGDDHGIDFLPEGAVPQALAGQRGAFADTVLVDLEFQALGCYIDKIHNIWPRHQTRDAIRADDLRADHAVGAGTKQLAFSRG